MLISCLLQHILLHRKYPFRCLSNETPKKKEANFSTQTRITAKLMKQNAVKQTRKGKAVKNKNTQKKNIIANRRAKSERERHCRRKQAQELYVVK